MLEVPPHQITRKRKKKETAFPVSIPVLLLPRKCQSLRHRGCRAHPLSDFSCACPIWPHVIPPIRPNLFCLPCCHNINAAKSRDNELRLCAMLKPAHNTSSPGTPCAIQPGSSQPGSLAGLLVKVKHSWRCPNEIFLYLIMIPCFLTGTVGNVYCLVLLSLSDILHCNGALV